MDIIEIEWLDSYFMHGWQDKEDFDKSEISRCKSTGYLIEEDKERIILAQSMSHKGHYGDMIGIPKCCIVKRKKLK